MGVQGAELNSQLGVGLYCVVISGLGGYRSNPRSWFQGRWP